MGIESGLVGAVQAIQGVAFLIFYIPQGMIPDSKKNYNKILLTGSFLMVFSLFLMGPFYGMPVGQKPDSYEKWYIFAGLALGGFGGACITPYGMPSMKKNMAGVYPASMDGELKNAMGSLLSMCFGLGNLIGCMTGGIVSTILKDKNCLRFKSPSTTPKFNT